MYFQTARHKASLLLVDRTLDLASSCGHHIETLLDRVVQSLPRLPSHSADVEVNMAPLCSIPRYCSDPPPSHIALPKLASVCRHHIETLLDRSLPRLPSHSADVEVNMAPLCSIPRYYIDLRPWPAFPTFCRSKLTFIPRNQGQQTDRLWQIYDFTAWCTWLMIIEWI